MSLLLQLSANQRYLQTSDGVPFLGKGDSGWYADVGLTRENIDLYFAERASQKFNTCLMSFVDTKFAPNAPANAYGTQPFVQISTPFVGYDLTQPIEEYWEVVDYAIDSAASQNIVVFACFLYIGFGGGDEGFWQTAVANGPTRCQQYGEFLGSRYEARDNIIWVNGGDWLPPDLTIPNAFAAGILSQDTRHLFTTHWNRGTQGYDASVSWLTLNSTYPDLATVSSMTQAAYLHSPTLATGDIEMRYEGSYAGQPALTTKEVRGQSWQAYLSGAAYMFYGDHGIWPFPADWEDHMFDPGALCMTELFEFMDLFRWWELIPDTSNLTVTSGRGTLGTTGYVTASRTPTGDQCAIYIPDGGAIQVNMARFPGKVYGYWYDPVSGDRTAVTGTQPFNNSGSRTFTPPGNNAGGSGNTDWGLQLFTQQVMVPGFGFWVS